MRILFLHISDMHLKGEKGFNEFQLKKLVDASLSCGKIDYAIIIISGDLAQSGKKQEYDAVQLCINKILSDYKTKYHNKLNIKVYFVPGNHDNNYPSKEKILSSKKLQNIRKKNTYENYINDQISMQEDFMKFAQSYECFIDSKIYSQRIIDFNNFKIEINMINTGIFSSLEEDKGLHYIPQSCINDYIKPSGADFIITIMHHAPDWYTDEIKNRFEEAIYKKSSIVFLGHEHKTSDKKISFGHIDCAIIQAGGELCEHDNWTRSAFFTGVLDTCTRSYTQTEFKWNDKQSQYENCSEQTETLPWKPSIERQIKILPEFEQKLLTDNKHPNLSTNLQNYYVFPRIQEEDTSRNLHNEYIDEESFIREILKKKKVIIYGMPNIGKTTLLKRLFLKLRDNYILLFCSTENIHGKNTKRMIKDSYEEVYGANASDFNRFEQTPKEKRIVFIDDIDQIRKESRELLLEELEKSFEYIFMTPNEIINLDLLERTKAILNDNNSPYYFRILPFYADKRKELIEKIVKMKIEDNPSAIKATQILDDAISSMLKAINFDTDFIVSYVECFCNNIGEIYSNDSSIFSKVFEANITNALRPYQTNTLSVDKLFVLLSKIAYYIHFNKAYPISLNEIINVIKTYQEEYGGNISYQNVLEAICSAKILTKNIDTQKTTDTTYRFSSRNLLAYFVAREINNQYNNTHDESDLKKIISCACFGINSDILLFISYIDNIQILRLLLNMATTLSKDWEEFNFKNMPKYLEAMHYIDITSPTTREKEKIIQNQVESEKKNYNEIQTIDIYDYSEEQVDRLSNEIINACSYLAIIAKCLPGFEHNMPKKDKKSFIEIIYKLPNQIFNIWSNQAEPFIKEIIEFFQKEGQNYILNQKNSTTADEILSALQKASLGFLLDLYRMAARYATKENTHSYLSEYPYKEEITHSLEHLWILERTRATERFVNEATELKKQELPPFANLGLKHTVYHALVMLSDFNHPQTNKLLTFFLINEKKELLFNKGQNSKLKIKEKNKKNEH